MLFLNFNNSIVLAFFILNILTCYFWTFNNITYFVTFKINHPKLRSPILANPRSSPLLFRGF